MSFGDWCESFSVTGVNDHPKSASSQSAYHDTLRHNHGMSPGSIHGAPRESHRTPCRNHKKARLVANWSVWKPIAVDCNVHRFVAMRPGSHLIANKILIIAPSGHFTVPSVSARKVVTRCSTLIGDLIIWKLYLACLAKFQGVVMRSGELYSAEIIGSTAGRSAPKYRVESAVNYLW